MPWLQDKNLIKEIENPEMGAGIAILTSVYGHFFVFRFFLKICGFHLLEELIFWGNVV